MSKVLQEFLDPEAAWTVRLVHYPDVPRRHVDLAEDAIRSVLDDTMTMSRELQGPPGWSVRKSGRAGRVFITVEEGLNSGASHLDSRIRGEFAAAPDEGDPDKIWARRIAEYAGLPLRKVDAAERVLEEVARSRRWIMSRTDRGTPGWLFELPPVGWQVFISAVDLGSRDIDHLVVELDRINDEPGNEDLETEADSFELVVADCLPDDDDGGEEPGEMCRRALAKAEASVDLIRQVAILVSGAEDAEDFERTYGTDPDEIAVYTNAAREIIALVRGSPTEGLLPVDDNGRIEIAGTYRPATVEDCDEIEESAS